MRNTTYRGFGWARAGLPTIAVLLATSWSGSAAAHIHLTSPPARYPMNAQKDAPCGADPAAPPGVVGGVTVFQAGEKITLTVDEFVGHRGSLRVAIDPTGTDTFEFPTSYDDLSGPNILASFEDPSGMSVHQLEVTLPDEPCDPCTLQVIQFMEDNTFSNDDFYFQCADIVIEGVGGATDGTEDSGPTDDTAGSASASATDTGGDDGADDGSATGGTAGTADAGDDGPGDGADDGADDAADDGASGGIGTGATDGDGSGSNDDSGGCSCSSTPMPASAMAGLFGLVLVRRRR